MLERLSWSRKIVYGSGDCRFTPRELPGWRASAPVGSRCKSPRRHHNSRTSGPQADVMEGDEQRLRPADRHFEPIGVDRDGLELGRGDERSVPAREPLVALSNEPEVHPVVEQVPPRVLVPCLTPDICVRQPSSANARRTRWASSFATRTRSTRSSPVGGVLIQ